MVIRNEMPSRNKNVMQMYASTLRMYARKYIVLKNKFVGFFSLIRFVLFNFHYSSQARTVACNMYDWFCNCFFFSSSWSANLQCQRPSTETLTQLNRALDVINVCMYEWPKWRWETEKRASSSNQNSVRLYPSRSVTRSFSFCSLQFSDGILVSSQGML